MPKNTENLLSQDGNNEQLSAQDIRIATKEFGEKKRKKI